MNRFCFFSISIVALCIIMCHTPATAQKNKKSTHKAKVKPYMSADYPADQWSTKIQNATLGEVSIQMIHVQNIGLEQDPECKAWIEVSKGSKTTGILFFDDIIADSGTAGIFVPLKQPREDLFIAFKLGDYDGRLIVVDRTGQITDLVGGTFYTDDDNEMIFANYASDQNGITVYDLEKNDWLIADSAIIKYRLGQWYYKDDNYFAVAQNDNPTDTTQITIGTLDMKKKKIIFSEVDKDYPTKDAMLKLNTYYTTPANKGNCSCGKR
ncbi:MAG: hypothetical protein HKL88_05000 [Bacteroidia bacterium]|nr:hypothetical protein [Bacteroidia bacterium]